MVPMTGTIREALRMVKSQRAEEHSKNANFKVNT